MNGVAIYMTGKSDDVLNKLCTSALCKVLRTTTSARQHSAQEGSTLLSVVYSTSAQRTARQHCAQRCEQHVSTTHSMAALCTALRTARKHANTSHIMAALCTAQCTTRQHRAQHGSIVHSAAYSESALNTAHSGQEHMTGDDLI